MTPGETNKACITRLITPETIILQLSGKTRDSVLRELVERIPELRSRPEAQTTLLRALQDRESLHSTGVGDGVALPHARSALANLVSEPTVVFGRNPTGIPFDSIDGQDVRLFFLIVTSKVTEHLQILARISRLLHRQPLRESLLAAKTITETLTAIQAAEQSL